MSLLDQLKSKKKSLERVETKVTTESGLVYKEIKSADGLIKQSLLMERTCGFVVDVKPDLHVGKVFEFLYFGSQDIACDLNILSSLQITDILSVGVAIPTNLNFMYTFIEAYDLPTFNMTNIFDDCFIYIENIRLLNRRVYIHCNAGISRSPSIIIAYVMKYLKLDFKSAYKFVKNTRLTIKPNTGFISQLIDYESKLKDNLYI